MNVLLVIADTVRWDVVGFNGGIARTPALDALARRSTVFRRHYATSFPTVPARHDILTGHAAFIDVGWGPLPRGRQTLAQVLARAGFSTIGVVDTPFYRVHGYDYDRGFQHFYDVRRQPVGWRPRLPGDSDPWEGRYPEVDRATGDLLPRPRLTEADYAAPTTFATAEACLEAVYRAPFFMLVDTWDPHEPWEAPDHYLRRHLADLDRPIVQPTYGRWEQQGISLDDLERARGAYAAKLEMVDHWLGRLLGKLRVLGIEDRTAIIFTTDHGFYFGEHGIYGKMVQANPGDGQWLRSPLYEEIAHIPLLIHLPGHQAQSVSALTTALDIGPTVLDIAGLPPEFGIGGLSLTMAARGEPFDGHHSVVTSLPLASPGDAQPVVDDFTRRIAEWQPMTLTTTDWSLLYSAASQRAELFQITRDPGQHHDVAGDAPEVVEDLVEELIDTHLSRYGATERDLAPRRPVPARSRIDTAGPSFFDRFPLFLDTSQTSPTLNRLDKRYEAIVAAHRAVFDGASVLDIASHDGRWTMAAIDAGASHVIGIEARDDLVAQAVSTLRAYGVNDARVRFIVGDVFEVLHRELLRVDVVLLLGFFYHVARHVELVRLIDRTGARHVIVDTAIMKDARVPPDAPNIIELRSESVAAQANQFMPDLEDGTEAIVGYPSRGAVRFLFDRFGFDCDEFDWTPLLADGRDDDLPDYRMGGRSTFFLRRRM